MSRLVTYSGQCEGLRCQRTQELQLLHLHMFLEGGTSFSLLVENDQSQELKHLCICNCWFEPWKPPSPLPLLEDFALLWKAEEAWGRPAWALSLG